MREDRYTVGIDFGTLSGRAVVVRVADGAELGQCGARLSARRHRAGAPATGERLRTDWALQDPLDYVEVLKLRCPRRCAAAGIDADPGDRHRHRLHRLHRLPTRADGTPLSALEVRRPPARLREAVEAPRRTGAGGPRSTSRRRARRGLAAPLRRQDLLGVAVREGRCSCSRRTPRSTRRPSAGSRPPTGSCGSCAGRRPATCAPPGTRPSTRTALPLAGLSRRARRRGFAGFTRQARRTRSPARDPSRHAHRARRPAGPACPRASRSRSATSTRT